MSTTATITVHLGDTLKPEELHVLATAAVDRKTNLDAITLEAVREWIAKRTPEPPLQHAA